MSESEHLRELADLSFEISRLMTDPKDAEAARRTGDKYLADAVQLNATRSDRAARPRGISKRAE